MSVENPSFEREEPEEVPEIIEEPEIEKSKEIKDADNFTELCDILLVKKKIKGRDGKEYETEEIKDRILAITDDVDLIIRERGKEVALSAIESPIFFSDITKTEGLREKVKELCKKWIENY